MYHRLARRLYPFRVAIGVLGGGAVIGFAAATLSLGWSIDALYALASLTALLWMLWLLSVTFIFVDPKPELEPAAPLKRRIVIRLRRGMALLLSVITTGLLFVAVAMTYRTVAMFASS